MKYIIGIMSAFIVFAVAILVVPIGKEVAIFRSVQSQYIPRNNDLISSEDIDISVDSNYTIHNNVLYLKLYVIQPFLLFGNIDSEDWTASKLEKLIFDNGNLNIYFLNMENDCFGVSWACKK